MNLWADFQNNADGRLIHKWKHYFPAYERHFAPFVGRSATIIEIGIGEGGSLQLWKRFFGPHAQIVGIDVAPRCKAFEEDQIAVRIGSQDDPDFLASIVDEFGTPDIVIDDGSHVMAHIAASFEALYGRLSKNGIYLIEDLHTAYRPEYGGALGGGNSFIESAKALIDELNADFTGDALPPTEFTRTTHSICFYDSIVVFERGTYTKKTAPQIGRNAAEYDGALDPGASHESALTKALRLELGSRREEVATLRAELAREREGLSHALGAVGEAEAERERLNAQIRAASDSAGHSRALIDRLRGEIADAAAGREQLATQLSTLRSTLEATARQSESTERRIRELQASLEAARATMKGVLGSKSWQVTLPLRLAGTSARRLASSFRGQNRAGGESAGLHAPNGPVRERPYAHAMHPKNGAPRPS
jgi:archaellum component FlaC